MNGFEKLQNIFNCNDVLLDLANRCDKAYCDYVGWKHTPFDIDSQSFKLNLNGLVALNAYISYRMEYYAENFDTVIDFIKRISNFTDEHNTAITILNIFCNTAWNAQRPLLGLERIPKMNIYSALDEKEKYKDSVQIITTIEFILEYVKWKPREPDYSHLFDVDYEKC